MSTDEPLPKFIGPFPSRDAAQAWVDAQGPPWGAWGIAAMFDVEPDPRRGQPWPWDDNPWRDGRCHRISAAWAFCARDSDHAGPHAERRHDNTTGAVWDGRPPAHKTKDG